MKTGTYELIIIGGGIAGMTAAIYAARASRRTAIIETNVCGGLVNWTYVIENFPSRIKVGGMELMQLVQRQVETLGVDIFEFVEIESLEIEGCLKELVTDQGRFEARSLIVATGRKPIPLPVKDAEDCEDVCYCSICDGPTYKGKKVLVVGGGNAGFEESSTCSTWELKTSS
jgi:thioredoxin reductase (NADPH)